MRVRLLFQFIHRSFDPIQAGSEVGRIAFRSNELRRGSRQQRPPDHRQAGILRLDRKAEGLSRSGDGFHGFMRLHSLRSRPKLSLEIHRILDPVPGVNLCKINQRHRPVIDPHAAHGVGEMAVAVQPLIHRSRSPLLHQSIKIRAQGFECCAPSLLIRYVVDFDILNRFIDQRVPVFDARPLIDLILCCSRVKAGNGFSDARHMLFMPVNAKRAVIEVLDDDPR